MITTDSNFLIFRTLENTLEIAREKSEIHNTYEATKLVGILDMSEFNLKQFAWRPGKEIKSLN